MTMLHLLTHRVSRCAVCLQAIASEAGPAAAVAAEAAATRWESIIDAAAENKWPASIHPSIHASIGRPVSHALQSGHRVSTASPQLTEHHRQTRPDRNTWSVGWGRWARRPVISCRQLDSLSSKHTAAGRPAGSTEPAANPLEMHQQTGKVGKVRAGVVWQMANRAAVGSSWKTKARRDRQTDGGREGQSGGLWCSEGDNDSGTSHWPPVTAILNPPQVVSATSRGGDAPATVSDDVTHWR